MIICPKCNKQLEDGSMFCDACGEKLEVQAAPAPQQEVYAAAPKAPLDIKKIAVIAGAAVAVVLLLILVGSLLFGGAPDYAMYIKDGELVYSNYKKPFEVTEDLADGIGNSELASSAYAIGYYTYLTEDGKKLFYLDEKGSGNSGGVLMVRNVAKPKSEPTKLDSDVRHFMVNENGNLVTYIKYDSDGSGTLYTHNLKEKTKIKSDVTSFVASLDGKTVIYETTDSDLYLKKGNKEADKIASEISELIHVNKSFSEIYYTKNDSLYLKKGSKDAEKVCSDVGDIIKFYEDGKFYYTEAEEEAEDGEDTKVDVSASTEASNAGDMIDAMVEKATKTLCYFDGKEKKVISEEYYGGYRASADEKVIAYSTVSASDISEEDMSKGLDAFKVWHVAFEEKSTEISLDDIYGLRITNDGKAAYVWTVEPEDEEDDDADEDTKDAKESTANLYKIKLSEKLGKAEEIDTEVYPSGISVTSDGHVIYFKDVKDNEGELFIDAKKIDDDVKLNSVTYMKDSKKVVYYSDWDSEKSRGTAEIATLKGKTTKIGDDISNMVITPDDEVLFLTEYKNNQGELYRFSGSKAKKLDDDVVGILHYNNYTNAVAREYGWIKD